MGRFLKFVAFVDGLRGLGGAPSPPETAWIPCQRPRASDSYPLSITTSAEIEREITRELMQAIKEEAKASGKPCLQTRKKP